MTMENNAALDAEIERFDRAAGERAANEVERLLSRFVWYPSGHCKVAHVLWILHTHLVQRFETTPRLAFLSPEPASGKTRALELTERLVPNPVSTVNVSPSYLFRKIGQGDTTILFDEIDTVFGPKAKDNEDVRGLLNAGYRRGAHVGRCVVKGKTIETEDFPAFAPVALAGLGWLPDTIMSRAVIVRMQRRAAGEKVEPYRRRIHDPETDRVRSLIEVWSRTVWTDCVVYPDMPHEIQDRDADVWEPLIAIADELGGAWPARARDAAVTLVTASKDRETSLGIRLLADIKEIFGWKGEMQTTAILEKLLEIDDAPWGDIKGKPLNARGLSKLLGQYGIKPTTIRFGSSTAKGYPAADFEAAWSRYLPPSPATSVTSVTNVTPLRAGPIPQGVVTDVTDVTHLQPDRGEVNRCAYCSKLGASLEISRSGTTALIHRGCEAAWIAEFDGGAE
jgi:hypothetical protein